LEKATFIPKKNRSLGRGALNIVAPIFVFAFFFAAFEFLVVALKLPTWLVSKPSDTIRTIIKQFHVIWPNTWVTIQEILIGYIIGVSFGITLALIFTSNKFLDRAVSPYVIFLIVTPQIIMVPLLMLWMGFGMEVKIAAVALSSFPINMMSTMTGVRSVSVERYELMKSLRATKTQTFFRVLIPSALPNVFNGMRLATIFATTSAVGAELISGNVGVGPQISYHTEFMMVDVAFAYVYVMILISVTFYMIISGIESLVLKRRR
jgi:NitT/TauT family transport system permease protein